MKINFALVDSERLASGLRLVGLHGREIVPPIR